MAIQLKIKNKFSLIALLFQSFVIGTVLMALIATARAGNTTWCIICGVLGGLNTFLLITNIINKVRPLEPEKADIENVQMNVTLKDAEKRILNAIVAGEDIEETKIFLDLAEKLIKPKLEE